MAAERKSTEIGRPFNVVPSRFAPERLPTELKKLWTLCREHGVEWSYDVRVVSQHGGTSKYRETARLHHRILRATLDSTAAAMRREHCTRILLPGRDIYMLAPMAARQGIPYLFVPELSRAVSDRPSCRPFLERLGVDGREMLLDTGYVGSIPKNLSRHFGVEFKFRLLSETDRAEVPKDSPAFERRPHQVFPNRQKSRQEALETEYLAKYWKCATHDPEGNIVQYFADRKSIQRAALLTSMLFRGIPFWKVSAPKKNRATIYEMGSNLSINQVGWVVNSTNASVTAMNFSTANTATTTTMYIGGVPTQVGIAGVVPMPGLAPAPPPATNNATLPPAPGAPIGLLGPAPAPAAVPAVATAVAV